MICPSLYVVNNRYHTNISVALFLIRQEKGEKKPIQEGALYKTPPLEKHPSETGKASND